MRPDELFPIALESLLLNKVRTGLTMLGIIIGVMSVITMIGLGQASQAQITQQVQGMGAATIIIQGGSPKVSGFGRGMPIMTLTLADVRALDNLSGTLVVAPLVSAGALVKLGKAAVGGSAIGSTEGVQEVRGLKLSAGRFFTEQEAETGARVVVLGAAVVKELFANAADEPIGAKVLVGKRRYRVIGILEEQSGFAVGGGGREAYMPIRAHQAAFSANGNKIGQVILKAENEGQLVGLQEAIRQVLRQRHGLTPEDDDDFRLSTQAELLSTIGSITQVFTGLLAGIAAISLLVGGIGIMNIMLVSVTERTREIGIRKAVGAKRRHILIQFLVESGALSLAGGIVGVILGLAITAIATRALGLPFVVSVTTILGAFAFSAGVGVFFGAYPAHRASRLDPVDALRYE